MKVKLEDIIEGIEMQSDEYGAYINVEAGELVYVSHNSLFIAEGGEDYDHLPEWEQEEVETAIDIVEDDGKYIELPTTFDMNEYDMMESFCYSLSDDSVQETLLHSIRGKGAFRRFKDKIHHVGIAEKWYDFRDKKYKDKAREFCERHNIGYIE